MNSPKVPFLMPEKKPHDVGNDVSVYGRQIASVAAKRRLLEIAQYWWTSAKKKVFCDR